MNEINIVTAQNVTLRIELASIGDRFIASLLDFLIKIGIIFAVAMIFSLGSTAGGRPESGAMIALGFIVIAIFVFYSLVFEYFMKGQTPGKRMMKIRVARLDGEPVSFGNILLRWLFRIIDFPLTWPVIGIITIVVTEKNQRVGDLVAGTILVSTKERRNLENTFYTEIEPGYVPQFPRVDQLTARQAEVVNQVLRIYASSDKYDLVPILAARIKELLQIEPSIDDLAFLRTILKDYNQATSTAANSTGTGSGESVSDHAQWMPPVN